jgi:3'-5' exoribonuclease
MARQYVDQLGAGDSVDGPYLVAEKQVRQNRQGAAYLALELRDRTGSIEARLWNSTAEQARAFEAGAYVQARGKVQSFQGALQVILTAVEPVEAGRIDPEEFLPPAVADVDGLYRRMRELLMGMHDPHLRALVEVFLADEVFRAKFLAAPAGVRKHHAYRGGLLEHVVTLLTAAHRIVDLYPGVDRDLLLTGIFLHDLGKIDELRYDHAFSYTDEGQLVGHLVMGVCLLRERIPRVAALLDEPFPEELRLRLEHMIVSHHGAYEFGSPKLPMTPEAIALHHLDSLDAKVHAFTRDIREASAGAGSWTPFDASLNRRLYRGASAATNGRSEG